MLHEREGIASWQPDALGSLLLHQAQLKHIPLPHAQLQADLAQVDYSYFYQLQQQQSHTASVASKKSETAWQMALSNNGVLLALLTDESLDIYKLPGELKHHQSHQDLAERIKSGYVAKEGLQSTDKSHEVLFHRHHSFGLQFDPCPELRRLAWSSCNKWLAVSYSDGSVEVLALHLPNMLLKIKGPPLPNTNSTGVNAILQSRKSLFMTEESTRGTKYESVKPLINPLAGLLWLECEKTGSSIQSDGRSFTHELWCFLPTGKIFCYLLADPGNDEAELEGEITVEREQPGETLLTFHHCTHLWMQWYASIKSVYYISADNSIVVVGNPRQLDWSSVTFWRLSAAFPFIYAIDPEVRTWLDQEKDRDSSSQNWLEVVSSWLVPLIGSMSKEQAVQTTASCSLSPKNDRLLDLKGNGDLSLFTLDCSKKYHDANERLLRRWKCWELVQLVHHHTVENPKQQLIHLKPVQVSWWSPDAILVQLDDGTASVLKLDLDLNLQLLSDLERIEARSSFIYQSNSLLLLEETSRVVRLRVRKKDGSFSWRYWDDHDDQDHEKKSHERWFRGTALQPIAWFLDLFLWNTEGDTKDMFRNMFLEERTFKLCRLKETLPYDLLLHLVQLGKFDDALQHAKDYELDADIVYQAQLTLPDQIQADQVTEWFFKIVDWKWKLQYCLESECKTAELQNAVLNNGLQLCDALLGSTEISVDMTRIVQSGQALLRRSNALFETFVEIYHGKEILSSKEEFSKMFALFKSKNILDNALDFANFGDWPFATHALSVLFQKHGDEILHKKLAILDAIPEILDPSIYAPILPGPKDGFTSTEIVTWYTNRARKIDQMTGQLDMVSTLLVYGIKFGFEALKMIHQKCQQFSYFVYDRFALENSGSTVCHLNFSEFLDSDPKSYLDLILNRSINLFDFALYQHDLTTHVWPLIASDRSLLRKLLDRIVEISIVDLRWLESSLECALKSPLFMEDDIHFVVSSSCSGCHRADQFAVIRRILDLLGTMNKKTLLLNNLILDLNLIMDGTNILDEYGLNASVKEMIAAKQNKDLQLKFIVKIARKKYISQNPQSRFEDLLGLQSTVCHLVDKKRVTMEFMSSLLMSDDSPRYFYYLKSFLFSDQIEEFIDLPQILSMTVSVARELVDNSDTCDLSRGPLKQALDCLDIFPCDSSKDAEETITKEKRFISTAAEIFKLTQGAILPIQIRQKNEFVVIKMVLDKSRHLARQPSRIVSLVCQLAGIEQDVTNIDYLKTKFRVLTMLKDIAIAKDEISQTSERCLEMIELVEQLQSLGMRSKLNLDVEMAMVTETCLLISRHPLMNDHSMAEKLLRHVLTADIDSITNVSLKQDIPVLEVITEWKKRDKESTRMITLEPDIASTIALDNNLNYYCDPFYSSFRNWDIVQTDYNSMKLWYQKLIKWIDYDSADVRNWLASQPFEEKSTSVSDLNIFAKLALSSAFSVLFPLLIKKPSLESFLDPRLPATYAVLSYTHSLKQISTSFTYEELLKMDCLLNFDVADIIKIGYLMLKEVNGVVHRSVRHLVEIYQERELKTLFNVPNIDGERFKRDKEYQKEIILGLTHSREDFERALKFGETYHINRAEIVTEHIYWAINSQILDEKLDAYLQSLHLVAEQYFTDLKLRLFDSFYIQQFDKFRFTVDLCSKWSKDAFETEQLKLRVFLLQKIHSTIFSLHELILLRYGYCQAVDLDEEIVVNECTFADFLEIKGVVQSEESIQMFCDLLPSIESIRLIHWLPSEEQLSRIIFKSQSEQERLRNVSIPPLDEVWFLFIRNQLEAVYGNIYKESRFSVNDQNLCHSLKQKLELLAIDMNEEISILSIELTAGFINRTESLDLVLQFMKVIEVLFKMKEKNIQVVSKWLRISQLASELLDESSRESHTDVTVLKKVPEIDTIDEATDLMKIILSKQPYFRIIRLYHTALIDLGFALPTLMDMYKSHIESVIAKRLDMIVSLRAILAHLSEDPDSDSIFSSSLEFIRKVAQAQKLGKQRKAILELVLEFTELSREERKLIRMIDLQQIISHVWPNEMTDAESIEIIDQKTLLTLIGHSYSHKQALFVWYLLQHESNIDPNEKNIVYARILQVVSSLNIIEWQLIFISEIYAQSPGAISLELENEIKKSLKGDAHLVLCLLSHHASTQASALEHVRCLFVDEYQHVPYALALSAAIGLLFSLNDKQLTFATCLTEVASTLQMDIDLILVAELSGLVARGKQFRDFMPFIYTYMGVPSCLQRLSARMKHARMALLSANMFLNCFEEVQPQPLLSFFDLDMFKNLNLDQELSIKARTIIGKCTFPQLQQRFRLKNRALDLLKQADVNLDKL